MKSLNRLLMTPAIVAAFALAAFAQTTPPATPAAPASQCDEQTNIKLYEEWRNNRASADAEVQKRAYAVGKEYLEKCTGTADATYINAVKKWMERYEKVMLEYNYQQALSSNNAAEAFRLGRQLIANAAADNPRTEIYTQLAWLGYSTSASNTSDAYNNESEQLAKRALALIQSGKQPQCVAADGKATPCWAPFNSREDLVGGLNFAVGHFATKSKRYEEAATSFHTAAQQSGFTKTTPSTYANLAVAYAYNAEYLRLIKEYETLVQANADAAGSEQAKGILARVDPHTDRIIDAYARAVALATDPKLAAQKAEWMKKLTDFYKFRNNNSDTGLDALIASVGAKPMPPVVTTLAPAPAPTPTGTGATAPAATTSTPPISTGVTSTTPPAPAATTTATSPATTDGNRPKP